MAESVGNAGRGARVMAKKRYIDAALLLLIFLAMALILFGNTEKVGKLSLPAVVLVFVFLRIGMAFFDKRASHLARRGEDADRGAAAEERVGLRLEQLPAGYFAFHDLSFEGFNVDHVVLGPAGIFLIETKSHGGRVTSEGGDLLVNGRPPEKNFLKQAWSQAYGLRDFLRKMTSKEWQVRPVLCFTNASVAVRKPVKGVEVVNVGTLTKFLESQNGSMSQRDIALARKCLRLKVEKPASA